MCACSHLPTGIIFTYNLVFWETAQIFLCTQLIPTSKISLSGFESVSAYSDREAPCSCSQTQTTPPMTSAELFFFFFFYIMQWDHIHIKNHSAGSNKLFNFGVLHLRRYFSLHCIFWLAYKQEVCQRVIGNFLTYLYFALTARKMSWPR